MVSTHIKTLSLHTFIHETFIYTLIIEYLGTYITGVVFSGYMILILKVCAKSYIMRSDMHAHSHKPENQSNKPFYSPIHPPNAIT